MRYLPAGQEPLYQRHWGATVQAVRPERASVCVVRDPVPACAPRSLTGKPGCSETPAGGKSVDEECVVNVRAFDKKADRD